MERPDEGTHKGSSTYGARTRRDRGSAFWTRFPAEHYAAGKSSGSTALGGACRLEGAVKPTRPGRTRAVGGEGTPARVAPLAARTHGPLAFTFYRGAALTMAADLATTPSTGCGPVLRRRALVQFRRVRDPGATGDILHQRPGRDASRPVGVGPQAPGRQLRGGMPGPRPQGRHGQGRATTCVQHVPRVDAEFQQLKSLELWYGRSARKS